MNTNIQQERYSWIKPILNKKLTYNEILKTCPHSKRSLERWVSNFKKYGWDGLKPKSTRPKSHPNETPIRKKEELISLRKKTKLCAKKLCWKLEKQNIHIPLSTAGRILRSEGLTRKYRAKKVKYKYIRTIWRPGDLIEIDVKYVPGKLKNRRYFQYTAIDTASRWRKLEIFDGQTSDQSVKFLKHVIQEFPHKIFAIKTDNHAIFTNYYAGLTKRNDLTIKTVHALDQFCFDNGITHYLIDPGKPAQNGKVERSHREDQEKFYERNMFRSVNDLKKKLQLWNDYYNNLEHCALDGKTPNEVLLNQPPKVLS